MEKMMEKGKMEDRTGKMGLKKIECDTECGFMIRSHDDNEIINTTMKHIKEQHQKDIPANEIRGMIKAVPMM